MEPLSEELKRALQADYEKLQGRRQHLQRQLQAIEWELDQVVGLLEHVRALLGDDLAEGVPSSPETGHGSSGESSGADSSDPVELAVSVLQERAGEPIHYGELAEAVLQRGGELPGVDPAQTLVSRLVRDDRFVRPFRRGWYALRLHHPRAKNVGARKQTERKKVQKVRLPSKARGRRA